MAIFEISPPDTGPYPVTVKVGATIFAQDGTTKLGTIDDPSLPFTVVGESADGKLVFLHGRVGGSRTPLGVVAAVLDPARLGRRPRRPQRRGGRSRLHGRARRA